MIKVTITVTNDGELQATEPVVIEYTQENVESVGNLVLPQISGDVYAVLRNVVRHLTIELNGVVERVFG